MENPKHQRELVSLASILPEEWSSLPLKYQSALAAKFQFLPQSRREGLEYVYSSLRTMREENLWFKDRDPGELDHLVPEIKELSLQAMKYHPIINFGNLHIVKQHPRDFLGATVNLWGRQIMSRVTRRDRDGIYAWEATRNLALAATSSLASDALPKAHDYLAHDVAWDMVRAAQWEAIYLNDPRFQQSRFEHLENPYLPLLELYKLGAIKFEFRQEEKWRTVTIDFSLDHCSFLGCLRFWSDGRGDKRVEYGHGWDEDCKKRRPLR